MNTRRSTAEPSLWEAGVRVVEATQQLVLDRLDLLRLEIRDDIAKLGLGVGLIFGGGLLLAGGWSGLMAALVLGLSAVLAPWLSALTLGLLHILGGGLCIWIARSRVLKGFYTLPVPEPTPQLPRPQNPQSGALRMKNDALPLQHPPPHAYRPDSQRDALLKEFSRSRAELSDAVADLRRRAEEISPRSQIINDPVRSLAISFFIGFAIGFATGD